MFKFSRMDPHEQELLLQKRMEESLQARLETEPLKQVTMELLNSNFVVNDITASDDSFTLSIIHEKYENTRTTALRIKLKDKQAYVVNKSNTTMVLLDKLSEKDIDELYELAELAAMEDRLLNDSGDE